GSTRRWAGPTSCRAPRSWATAGWRASWTRCAFSREADVPVEERQIRTGLLNFADALEARTAAETATAPGPELHLLTFALDREEFGIPVTQVREVIRVSDITRVPQAPPHVRGVANLRGR